MIKSLFVLILFTMSQLVMAKCELPYGSYVVLPETSIIEELGLPTTQDTFKMKDGISEFRVELLNIYPTNNPQNLDVQIWERTWNKGDCRITIWFHEANHQKFSILSLGWNKNEEF